MKLTKLFTMPMFKNTFDILYVVSLHTSYIDFDEYVRITPLLDSFELQVQHEEKSH